MAGHNVVVGTGGGNMGGGTGGATPRKKITFNERNLIILEIHPLEALNHDYGRKGIDK